MLRKDWNYKDIVAFHPGYYVADIIEDMGISQAEFATRMGTTAKTLSNLVNGQINLSNDLAKKMSVMLGTSPDVWLNLQSAYDQKLIEIEMKQFSPNKYTTDEEIVAFAKSSGIHPGIVAGRLQHEKIIPPNRCAHLKEKYAIAFWF